MTSFLTCVEVIVPSDMRCHTLKLLMESLGWKRLGGIAFLAESSACYLPPAMGSPKLLSACTGRTTQPRVQPQVGTRVPVGRGPLPACDKVGEPCRGSGPVQVQSPPPPQTQLPPPFPGTYEMSVLCASFCGIEMPQEELKHMPQTT